MYQCRPSIEKEFSYRVRPYVEPTAVTHLTGMRLTIDKIRRPGAQGAYGRYAGMERIRFKFEKTFTEESQWIGATGVGAAPQGSGATSAGATTQGGGATPAGCW